MGGAMKAIGGIAREALPMVGGSLKGLPSGLNTVAKGVEKLPGMGIAAAKTAFESASSGLGGVDKALKAGIGEFGKISGPGRFLSELGDTGKLRNVLSEVRNTGLDIQQQLSNLPTMDQAPAGFDKLYGLIANVSKSYHDMSSEAIRRLRG